MAVKKVLVHRIQVEKSSVASLVQKPQQPTHFCIVTMKIVPSAPAPDRPHHLLEGSTSAHHVEVEAPLMSWPPSGLSLK